MSKEFSFHLNNEVVMDWEDQRFNLNMEILRAKCHLKPQHEIEAQIRAAKLSRIGAKIRDTLKIFIPVGA